jgi:UDP-N-acetylglucosamine--N-acetylmuramyl-(pentapeptide) pyrophosphoryl-undecaprenol N-acetylglucosamine transferase
MAGGTGGHIFPGIAVARELATRDVATVWLGSAHGLENRLVPEAGIALERITISGLRGKGWAALAAAPFRLARALIQALRIVARVKPRAVIAFGGFAAGPGGVAAWLQRRPLIVHEQNRRPGVTNRILARFARRVLAGFPDAFPEAAGAEAVGNPVRTEIAAIAQPAERLRGRTGPIRILVLGGSQGARALNRAVPAALRRLPRELAVDVLHQTGRTYHDETWTCYAEAHVQARTEPFIDDMASAYAWADLVVGRAGALTLAEICAAGVASVLVPFPYAVDDHQAANAEHLVRHGAALMLRESDDLAERLGATLLELVRDRDRLQGMAAAARELATPQAAQRIADVCLTEAAR